MSLLSSCRNDLVLLVEHVEKEHKQYCSENGCSCNDEDKGGDDDSHFGVNWFPSYLEFSNGWKKLSFQAIHFACYDNQGRDRVVEDMCYCAMEMMNPRVAMKLRVCGLFVIYALYQTKLRDQEVKVKVAQDYWPHITKSYSKWKDYSFLYMEPLQALKYLLQQNVFVWVTLNPSILREPNISNQRLWAVQTASTLSQPAPVFRPSEHPSQISTLSSSMKHISITSVLSNSSINFMEQLESEYAKMKKRVQLSSSKMNSTSDEYDNNSDSEHAFQHVSLYYAAKEFTKSLKTLKGKFTLERRSHRLAPILKRWYNKSRLPQHGSANILPALVSSNNNTEDEDADADADEFDEHDDDTLLLDADAIVNAVGAESVDDVVVAQLEDMDFGAAIPEDLACLVKLQRIRAGENSLVLEDFAYLPNLRVLELQSNLISTIPHLQTHFSMLQVLVLAHNNIPSADIIHLARLPSLRSLDLSYNMLKVFPQIFEGLTDPFSHLESLILAHNKLSGGQVFAACAGLASLSYLALDSNHLKFIPKLVADDTMPDVRPFPCLELLTINKNKIASSKDILQCEYWPNLQEVQVIDTPFSRSFRHVPKEIEELISRSGIMVVTRKETKQEKMKKERETFSNTVQNLCKIDTSEPVIRPKEMNLSTTYRPVLPSRARLPLLPPIHDREEDDDDGNRGRKEHEANIEVIESAVSLEVHNEMDDENDDHDEKKIIGEESDLIEEDRTISDVLTDNNNQEETPNGEDNCNSLKNNKRAGSGVFLTALLGEYGDDLDEEEGDEEEESESESEDGGAFAEDELSTHDDFKKKKRSLPRPKYVITDVRVPQNPFQKSSQRTLKQYQRERTKPKPTASTLGIAEARRLLGLAVEGDASSKLKSKPLTNEEILHYLDMLKTCDEISIFDALPHNTSINLDALKFRGYEEFLVESSDEENDTDMLEDAPVGSRRAVQALDYALKHPLKLSAEARKRFEKPVRRRPKQSNQGQRFALTGVTAASTMKPLPPSQHSAHRRKHYEGARQEDNITTPQQLALPPIPGDDQFANNNIALDQTSGEKKSKIQPTPPQSASRPTTMRQGSNVPRSRQRLLHLQSMLSNLNSPRATPSSAKVRQPLSIENEDTHVSTT
eukprot:m.73895 g.73895  ORF g.73895 m.73895 type:complete len:1127 (+) comp8432_c2_seq3:194-3574(+)